MASYNINLTPKRKDVAQQLCNQGIGTSDPGQIDLTVEELCQWVVSRYLRNKGIMLRNQRLKNISDEELTDIEDARTDDFS